MNVSNTTDVPDTDRRVWLTGRGDSSAGFEVIARFYRGRWEWMQPRYKVVAYTTPTGWREKGKDAWTCFQF